MTILHIAGTIMHSTVIKQFLNIFFRKDKDYYKNVTYQTQKYRGSRLSLKMNNCYIVNVSLSNSIHIDYVVDTGYCTLYKYYYYMIVPSLTLRI